MAHDSMPRASAPARRARFQTSRAASRGGFQKASAGRRTACSFSALPFVLSGMADLLGGWLTDRLARTHGLRVVRCGLGFTAFLACGAIAWLAIDPYRQIVAGRIIETS
jgi:hypothetical protein